MQHDQDVFTITQFCAATGLSRATFYRLREIGRAPKLMQVGARVLISRESFSAWRASVEADPIPPLNKTAA